MEHDTIVFVCHSITRTRQRAWRKVTWMQWVLSDLPRSSSYQNVNSVIAMQTYYGGRSETRIRCAEVPVVPVDFTSEYPTCCALLGLFDVLTAKSVTFKEDTESVRRLLSRISLEACFEPEI
jgi:hypothetical protein